MTDPVLPGIKLFEMHGRVAMITGGSKGLGYAMAAALASAGAHVMLVNRKLDEGQDAASKLEADYPVKARAFAADVTDLPQENLHAAHAVQIVVDLLNRIADRYTVEEFERSDGGIYRVGDGDCLQLGVADLCGCRNSGKAKRQENRGNRTIHGSGSC